MLRRAGGRVIDAIPGGDLAAAPPHGDVPVLVRIRRRAVRLRILVALALTAVVAAQLAVAWARFGTLDAGFVIVIVGLGIVLFYTASGWIGAVTRERQRHAAMSVLPGVLLVPRSIEETAQASLQLLAATGVADAGLIAIAQDGGEATPTAAAGYPAGWADSAPPISLPRAGSAPLVARDEGRHPWVLPLTRRVAERPWVARVPLVSGGESIGLLMLAAKHIGLLGDRALLAALAEQLAGALDHAALYEAAYAREQNLEEQDARRREFLAAISHEIRTPLTSIRAFAELLALDEESLGETAEQLVASLGQGVDRLTGLVNDLLDLGKVQDSQMEADLAPVDVASVLRQGENVLRPAFMLRQQALELDLPEGHLSAMADRRHLEQVVLNLLSNANRHTPTEGEVIVRAWRDGDLVRIEIEDSGPGIAPADRERVFEPYYRVQRPGAPAVPGSGLGLAVARRLVELQHGHIWVEEGDTRGARFCVELPAAGAHE